uniref:Uncharacterized protein n=1 Tax=Myoviridae sp. ctkmZ20 TaxID=2825166 RepID=A0A8S5NTU8_9CAUD|nr:MAG TPA: hypothetical protein [Myoviridae sp. ctkmZ20]
MRVSIIPPPFNIDFYSISQITTYNHLSCLAWLAKRRGFLYR